MAKVVREQQMRCLWATYFWLWIWAPSDHFRKDKWKELGMCYCKINRTIGTINLTTGTNYSKLFKNLLSFLRNLKYCRFQQKLTSVAGRNTTLGQVYLPFFWFSPMSKEMNREVIPSYAEPWKPLSSALDTSECFHCVDPLLKAAIQWTAHMPTSSPKTEVV